MTRPIAVLSVLAALACGGLAGCGNGRNGSGGEALPVNPPQLPTDQPTSTYSAAPGRKAVGADSAESGPAGAATAALRPCDLLTEAERQRFHVVIKSQEVVGYSRFCDMNATDQYAISVAIFDTLSIEDIHSDGAKRSFRVGGRPAVEYQGGVSSCAISLRVSETSRVDVLAATGKTSESCAVANRVAPFVEAKLP